jgi:HTH-type transcriptional regulator/antitoxin HigA
MEYTIIHTKKQYKEYCKKIMELSSKKSTKKIEDEIELLQVLIDKWDKENYKSEDEMDPIQLLKYIMENKNLSQADLVPILGINKSAVSQIMSYKRGLSKEVIRKLSSHFKMTQEAFNRSYPLVSEANRGHVNEKMMNTTKVFARV